MRGILILYVLAAFCGIHTYSQKVCPQKIDNLVCFWDFSEEAGKNRISKVGKYSYELLEGENEIAKIEDGVFGNYSADIKEGDAVKVEYLDNEMVVLAK